MLREVVFYSQTDIEAGVGVVGMGALRDEGMKRSEGSGPNLFGLFFPRLFSVSLFETSENLFIKVFEI